MDKFIINPKGLIKNILITDDLIRITDEDYKTKEAFLEKLNNGKKEVLDTIHQIEYGAILKIVPYTEDNAFQLFFKENNKNEKTYLEFETQEELNEILAMLFLKLIYKNLKF